ncbi:hypothetical protein GJ496_001334 [Pomphorhynchus laevis]|nr:hypothetical protein GJ496_001334 [Pomphorhynchus laevis]
MKSKRNLSTPESSSRIRDRRICIENSTKENINALNDIFGDDKSRPQREQNVMQHIYDTVIHRVPNLMKLKRCNVSRDFITPFYADVPAKDE